MPSGLRALCAYVMYSRMQCYCARTSQKTVSFGTDAVSITQSIIWHCVNILHVCGCGCVRVCVWVRVCLFVNVRTLEPFEILSRFMNFLRQQDAVEAQKLGCVRKWLRPDALAATCGWWFSVSDVLVCECEQKVIFCHIKRLLTCWRLAFVSVNLQHVKNYMCCYSDPAVRQSTALSNIARF